MNTSAPRLAWCGLILTAAASSAAAFVVTPTNDAFDLAAALAPAPTGLASVTGQSVDFGGPVAAAQFGTFTDGQDLLGISSGIILSTGNANGLGFGATEQNTSFGRVASTDFTNFAAGTFTPGVSLNDAGRFTVTIDPGLESNFVNFRLGFGTNEVGAQGDYVGLFVNGAYRGFISGSSLDQHHPWGDIPSTAFGLNRVVFPNGLATALPSFLVSIEVPSPGTEFMIDFLIADSGDDTIDSALFLGELTGSVTPLGTVASAIPEPSTFAMLAGLAGLVVAAGRRTRRQV